jgi:hypothetical protein
MYVLYMQKQQDKCGLADTRSNSDDDSDNQSKDKRF